MKLVEQRLGAALEGLASRFLDAAICARAIGDKAVIELMVMLGKRTAYVVENIRQQLGISEDEYWFRQAVSLIGEAGLILEGKQ